MYSCYVGYPVFILYCTPAMSKISTFTGDNINFKTFPFPNKILTLCTDLLSKINYLGKFLFGGWGFFWELPQAWVYNNFCVRTK